MRYRDLPALHFTPPPSGRLELPQDAKVGGLFISPGGQVHWTSYQQRASTILADDGRQIDLRAPGGGQFRFPIVQQFPDGRWLIIESRTDAETANAFVFNPNGALVNSFYAGDGIEAALLDERGDIWVGYFDEGVFGAIGHPGPSRDHPCYRYGPNGLIRLSDRGEIEFEYNSHFGQEPGRFIDWIFALTVAEDRAWFHAASRGFVASVLDNHVEYVLPETPSIGVRALGVGPRYFSFFGGYKRSSMVAVVDRSTQCLRLMQLRRGDGTTLSPVRLASRGTQAIAVADNRLYRLDQDILLEALGPWTDDNASTLESAVQYRNEEACYADSWMVYPKAERIPGTPRPLENQPRNDEDTPG